MSIFQKISEPIRAIADKLKPLTQPRFWAPMGITAVVVAFFWELSEHPEWLELDDIQEAITNPGSVEEGLSPEDRSIAAEIDSSGLLLEQLQGPQLSPFPVNDPINAGEGLVEEVRKSSLDRSATSATSAAPLQQPQASAAPLPDFPVAPTASDPNNIFNLNPTPQTQASPAALPQQPAGLIPPISFEANSADDDAAEENPSNTSPLQAAIDQYTQKQAEPGTSPANTVNSPVNLNQAQVNPLNTPGQPATAVTPTVGIPPATWVVPRAATAPVIPSAPAPATNPYQTSISIPQPAVPSQPMVPTRTGAVPTPDLQNIYNSYGTYPNVNSGVYPNTAYPAQPYPGSLNNGLPNPQNYQVNQNTLIQTTPADQFNQMNQRSFSVPRPIPGRTIGGGEINTFANP